MTERILIVDDSPTQLAALRLVLEDGGFTVEDALSGESAIQKLKQDSFDLVISDVVMPGISGYDLGRWLKRESERTAVPPLVLLTGLSDPRDIVRGLECGAANYVTKPYDPETLVKRIRTTLHNLELARQADERNGGVPIHFLGETYRVTSSREQILGLLLSSFEELVRTNEALEESKRKLAYAHRRELEREREGRARAEEDARQMESLARDAEAATRARDELLAAVSHDLRNPLGAIYMTASLLLETSLDEETKTKQIATIRRTANRMTRLIEDLLDASKMEVGRFVVDPQPDPVEDLLEDAREDFEPIASGAGVALEVVPPDANLLVLADHYAVLRVLSNLVGNALKFTPEGGTVRLETSEDGERVRFAVSDTGPGVEEEAIPLIFERFWQSGPRKGEGSGLGLAIAKGIVEAHQGRIWVESEPGEGSTFYFTLPRASSSAG